MIVIFLISFKWLYRLSLMELSHTHISATCVIRVRLFDSFIKAFNVDCYGGGFERGSKQTLTTESLTKFEVNYEAS